MEEQQPVEQPNPEVEQVSGIAGEIVGQSVTFGPGLVGFIRSEQDASLTRGGALSVAAGQDMEMSDSGAAIAAVGRDMTVENGGVTMAAIGKDLQLTNGGGMIMTAGKDIEITDGGAMLTLANQATINNGSCGILIASQANFGEDTKVILNTPQALALGAAFGAVFALLSWLLRRR